MSLRVKALVVHTCPSRFLRVVTKSRARPQLLFACDACTGVFFFSSAQPENPKENSYVVASNHLTRFSSSYELCGCTNGFFLYVSKMILIGNELQLYVPLMCNPSTGQFITLPKLKSGKSCGVESYLGYEPVANELKVFSMEWSRVSGVSNVARKWICISGVIYYAASSHSYSLISMVACFDLRSEKLSFIKFMETFSKEMHHSATIVNYNGKLGLLMSRDFGLVHRANASFELWVLQDAAKHEWSKLVFVLPPLWKDVVVDTMCISGMVGKNEIVFSPIYQRDPFYVIYYNVESKTITKVGIQGLEAFQGKSLNIYLNYVENLLVPVKAIKENLRTLCFWVEKDYLFLVFPLA
uniref:F-box associated beta-propeller type 3 domain-containing protein n=1 Tax=Brassica oleracea var. oleracea TaxID=109376 RepID=A0A0D3C2W9_BRAOL